MKNFLSYEEFIALAQKYYNQGGDGIVECWDETMFNEQIEMFGGMTKSVALSIIKARY